MNKEFIPYEQALKLKELGFDEECLGWYPKDTAALSLHGIFIGKPSSGSYKILAYAPLYQQVFRWFREKHDKHCYVEAYTLSSGGKRYDYTILSNEGEDEWDDGETWETYEQAEFACLKKLIEIIKNK